MSDTPSSIAPDEAKAEASADTLLAQEQRRLRYSFWGAIALFAGMVTLQLVFLAGSTESAATVAIWAGLLSSLTSVTVAVTNYRSAAAVLSVQNGAAYQLEGHRRQTALQLEAHRSQTAILLNRVSEPILRLHELFVDLDDVLALVSQEGGGTSRVEYARDATRLLRRLRGEWRRKEILLETESRKRGEAYLKQAEVFLSAIGGGTKDPIASRPGLRAFTDGIRGDILEPSHIRA